jgi:uncharacterized membrane protein YdjX (TVP38/TMEM64 family)
VFQRFDWLMRTDRADCPPGPRTRAAQACFLTLLGVMLAVLGTAVGFGLDGQFGLALLRQHQAEALGFVAGEPLLASLIFMIVYGIAVAVSVPGVAVLTVIGGFLFGWLQGTVYVVTAATLAATLVFLIARSALGASLRGRAGPSVQRYAERFRANAISYLFVLHLVPIFPYVLVITLPALCGVRLRTFVLAASFGILPGTVLLACFGSGLGEVLTQSTTLELSSFLIPEIILALAGLVALALLPIAWRAWFGGQRA